MSVSTLIALVVLSPAVALGPSATDAGPLIGGTHSGLPQSCEESNAGCLGIESGYVPAVLIGDPSQSEVPCGETSGAIRIGCFSR